MTSREEPAYTGRYLHRCGQTYVRRVEVGPPHVRMIICEHCLEPMPLCDDDRNRFRYDRYVPGAARAALQCEPVAAAPIAAPSRMFDLAVWASLASLAEGRGKPAAR